MSYEQDYLVWVLQVRTSLHVTLRRATNCMTSGMHSRICLRVYGLRSPILYVPCGSSDFGSPQTRTRSYFLMCRVDGGSDNVVQESDMARVSEVRQPATATYLLLIFYFYSNCPPNQEGCRMAVS